MSYEPVDLIEVRAWDRTVGAVALDPSSGFYAFEYDDAWLRSGIELAPLHLPKKRGTFVFPQLSRETYYRGS